MSIATGLSLLKRSEEYVRTPEEFNLKNRIVPYKSVPKGLLRSDARKAKYRIV